MVMPSKLEMAKMVVSAVIGSSVGKVTGDIIDNNVTIDTGADNAKVWIAKVFIGVAVAATTKSQLDNAIEQVNLAIVQAKEEVKEDEKKSE
jgi:hypothetical protein